MASTGGRAELDLGIERVVGALERLGRPHDRLHVVHVAGTNGKGSVCALIAAAVRASGQSVGRFTSPFLVEERDSIRVWPRSDCSASSSISWPPLLHRPSADDCDDAADVTDARSGAISEDTFAAALERALRAEPSMTRFEALTVAALTIFAEASVDIAVVEVGVGGRRDATNIFTRNVISVITAIGMDHGALLGCSTREEIALEKAGIFKSGCAAVIAPQCDQRVADVLYHEAQSRGCHPIVVRGSPASVD